MPDVNDDVDLSEVDPEFTAMWNAQLLDYPTIRRIGDDEWDYFAVEPDSADPYEQGAALARRSLHLADRCAEADSCALMFIFHAAADVARREDTGHDLCLVVNGFINEILDAAVCGISKLEANLAWYDRYLHREETTNA